ncbi:hypothetical protein [Candidatus Tisiphia endosymbiont of Thecophora atra]|uniref:hypothetical protein n=1 Tax=Candidatus Tisiphia endosymbiont of Thecophora atra TaxID=3066258 RepID=UPI00312C91F8
MKTVLPERSLIIQERLDNIVREILNVSKHKIAMIILFGSYARGDWVQDKYKKGHITYSYQSDLVKKFNFLSHNRILSLFYGTILILSISKISSYNYKYPYYLN